MIRNVRNSVCLYILGQAEFFVSNHTIVCFIYGVLLKLTFHTKKDIL